MCIEVHVSVSKPQLSSVRPLSSTSSPGISLRFPPLSLSLLFIHFSKLDQIRNERIRGTTKEGEIAKKVQERRLRWYGHVMRREEHYIGRRAMEMKVQGRRKRGRPKRRWLDNVKDDIKEKRLSADEVYDRATWRRISNIDPT